MIAEKAVSQPNISNGFHILQQLQQAVGLQDGWAGGVGGLAAASAASEQGSCRVPVETHSASCCRSLFGPASFQTDLSAATAGHLGGATVTSNHCQ